MKTCYNCDCAFWNHCENSKSECTKRNIKIDETTEICGDFKEATYRITPKGCFSVSLIEAHLCNDFEDPNLLTSFRLYEMRMRKNGYIMDENSTEEELNAMPTEKPDDIFKNSIIDGFGFDEDDSKALRKINTAFELFVDGMKVAGYY